jgi:hypothetical protein
MFETQVIAGQEQWDVPPVPLEELPEGLIADEV